MGIKIGITGKPGSGKTTLLKRIWEEFKNKYKIIGFITEEVRKNNERVGFIAKRLDKKEKVVLAWKGGYGSKVGKYSVFTIEFENFISNLLEDINKDFFDLIIIDEIGPMELKSGKFIKLINYILNSDKNVLASVHLRLVNKYKDKFNYIFEVNREKFEEIYKSIIKKLKILII